MPNSSNLSVDATRTERIFDTACATLAVPVPGSTDSLTVQDHRHQNRPSKLGLKGINRRGARRLLQMPSIPYDAPGCKHIKSYARLTRPPSH